MLAVKDAFRYFYGQYQSVAYRGAEYVGGMGHVEVEYPDDQGR